MPARVPAVELAVATSEHRVPDRSDEHYDGQRRVDLQRVAGQPAP
jgi:hypothetical protein